MSSACTSGLSLNGLWPNSARVLGTNTSSFSMLHVFEWWLPWLMRHEW